MADDRPAAEPYPRWADMSFRFPAAALTNIEIELS
jgi:hypothetical protein